MSKQSPNTPPSGDATPIGVLIATRPEPVAVDRRTACPEWCSHVHDLRDGGILHQARINAVEARQSVEWSGTQELEFHLVQWDVIEDWQTLRYPARIELRLDDGTPVASWDTPAAVAEFAQAAQTATYQLEARQRSELEQA